MYPTEQHRPQPISFLSAEELQSETLLKKQDPQHLVHKNERLHSERQFRDLLSVDEILRIGKSPHLL